MRTPPAPHHFFVTSGEIVTAEWALGIIIAIIAAYAAVKAIPRKSTGPKTENIYRASTKFHTPIHFITKVRNVLPPEEKKSRKWFR